jgi:hypothetical protein
METSTKSKGLVPTKAEAIDAAKSLGGLTLGMIIGHNVGNFTKTQKPMVRQAINGGMLIGGTVAYIKSKNQLVKFLGLGAAAFGTLNLIAAATTAATQPGTTNGLGFIPDSVKSSIRKFIPTFAGIEDVSGFNGMGNDDEFLSLDDAGEDGMGNDEPASNAMGSAMSMAA